MATETPKSQAQCVADIRHAWDAKAAFRDERMGDGNAFQLELIAPAVERLLDVRPGERILDVACGNGVSSRRRCRHSPPRTGMHAPSPGATSPTSRRSWRRASCRGVEHDAMDGRPVTDRPTARVIVLDEGGRVPLFQIEDLPFPHAGDPDGERLVVFWITPGGGVEPGESFEEAARRELREETGFDPESVGPCLFEDEVLIARADRDIRLHIRFYLARVAGEVSLDGLDAIERSVFRAYLWWTVDELEVTTETVYPPHIAALAREAAHRGDAP